MSTCILKENLLKTQLRTHNEATNRQNHRTVKVKVSKPVTSRKVQVPPAIVPPKAYY